MQVSSLGLMEQARLQQRCGLPHGAVHLLTLPLCSPVAWSVLAEGNGPPHVVSGKTVSDTEVVSGKPPGAMAKMSDGAPQVPPGFASEAQDVVQDRVYTSLQVAGVPSRI